MSQSYLCIETDQISFSHPTFGKTANKQMSQNTLTKETFQITLSEALTISTVASLNFFKTKQSTF